VSEACDGSELSAQSAVSVEAAYAAGAVGAAYAAAGAIVVATARVRAVMRDLMTERLPRVGKVRTSQV
jgi:hypothetical protein